MNRRATLLCGILLTGALGWWSCAAATEGQAGSVLPALRFTGDAVGGEFYEPIQHSPQFGKMNREALGSPIELRVYHTYRINRGSAATTGLLAAATLGLLPEVSSGEHAIVYEVFVNGVVLTSYKYSKVLTHAHNVWTKDTTHGMGKEGIEWARSTVDLFLKDAAADPKLAALAAEFDYYFGPTKP